MTRLFRHRLYITAHERAARSGMRSVQLVLVVCALLAALWLLAVAAGSRLYDRIVRDFGDGPAAAAPPEVTGEDGRWLDELYGVELRRAQHNPFRQYADLVEHPMAGFDSYNVGALQRWPWSSPHTAVLDMSGLRDGMCVLDLGCGAGGFALHACAQLPALRVTAVANSQALVDIVNARAAAAGVAHRLTAVVADFDDPAWQPPHEAFDTVLSLESIGYSKDRRGLLRKLCASLRPRGTLFVKTPTFRGATTPWVCAGTAVATWAYNFSTPDLIRADLADCGFATSHARSFSLWAFFVTTPVHRWWPIAVLSATQLVWAALVHVPHMQNTTIVAVKP